MSNSRTATGASAARAQTVTHHPERHCFVSSLGGGEAVLDYRLLADRRINFYHTHVPESLRGQGVAEALVRAGLAWARQEGLRIEASCWYVQRFLRA